MAIRVAINGFGRIGRIAFRQMFGSGEFDIVAVNGIESAEMAAYLLKYDSAQGRYGLCDQVSAGEHSIIIGEKEIPLFNVRKAEELPWKEIGVDVVAECSGAYRSKEKAMDHIHGGAKKVVISAPAGDDVPTIVYNVNHKVLGAEDLIVSAASCTTNCLAPMADILHRYAPIKAGLMTSIHAYTGDQKTLDAPHKKGNYRRARAAGVNIVPNSSGAASAIGLVIPELNGRMNGSAQRVPVATGSSTILMAVVKRAGLTVEGINKVMKENANETLGYNTEDIVSSDIIGTTYGGVFDATQTMVTPVCDDLYEVQVVAWYDNESGYTSQMVRTIKYVAEL